MTDVAYSEESDFSEKLSILGDISHWVTEVMDGSEVRRSLEIGGSGGLLAGLYAERWGHTICTDIVDWDLRYQGQAMKLLGEKFSRNGYHLPISLMNYIPSDAQDLFFRDNWFDVVFSLNAFEHIPDPAKALCEAIRTTRPGGMIYLRFDPVWTADSGSHFLHRINDPWAHLVCEDDEIAAIMQANGAAEDEIQSYRSDMNRRPVSYYRETLPKIVDDLGCTMVFSTAWSGVVDQSFLTHPNLIKAASKQGLEPDDLLIRGFQFVIKKG